MRISFPRNSKWAIDYSHWWCPTLDNRILRCRAAIPRTWPGEGAAITGSRDRIVASRHPAGLLLLSTRPLRRRHPQLSQPRSSLADSLTDCRWKRSPWTRAWPLSRCLRWTLLSGESPRPVRWTAVVIPLGGARRPIATITVVLLVNPFISKLTDWLCLISFTFLSTTHFFQGILNKFPIFV